MANYDTECLHMYLHSEEDDDVKHHDDDASVDGEDACTCAT